MAHQGGAELAVAPRRLSEEEDRFDGAAGLAQMRPGFCYAPDYDALFALGWPHLRFVVDGHREDEDPPASALRILTAPEPPARFAWPRRASRGLVRAWGLPALFERAPGTLEVRREAREAVWRDAPVDAAEAAVLVACRVAQDEGGLTERAVANFVLVLEALVGTEAVGAAVLDALEQLPAEVLLTEWTLPPVVSWHLGFLALRVPTSTADAWRVRMRRLLDVALEIRPELRRTGFRGAGSSHARALHLVLHGGQAAESASDRTLRWYAHVTDDPVLVRMRVAVNRQAYEPDARLVFLGGPDVLGRYTRDWSQLGTTEAQRWFFEQVAPIRAPEMYPLMLELAGRSLVRGEALGWFLAHAEDAAPFLAEAAAGDGASAVHARQVLKLVGG